MTEMKLLANINRCYLELKFVHLNEQKDGACISEPMGYINNHRNAVFHFFSPRPWYLVTHCDFQHHNRHILHPNLTPGKYGILMSEM